VVRRKDNVARSTERTSSPLGSNVSAQPVRRGLRAPVLVVIAVAVVATASLAATNLAGSTKSPPPSESEANAGLAAAVASASTAPAPSIEPAPPSEAFLPSAAPSPTPSLAPVVTPVRRAVNLNIEPRPNVVFKTEVLNTWCAAAAVQMTLNVIGPTIDTSTARQRRIHLLEVANTTRADSSSRGGGP